jgi:hypothetical protein
MKRESARNGEEPKDAAADDVRSSTTEATQAHAEEQVESGWVTTDVAAAALRRSPRRVREYIRRGLLAAKTEGEGVSKRWLVSINSLNALLNEDAYAKGPWPGVRPGSTRGRRSDRKGMSADEVAVVDAAELLDAVQELHYRLGQAEARAELTEKAESTLRESLEREQLRTDAERERADRLEEMLQQARRGWLRRFFGF